MAAVKRDGGAFRHASTELQADEKLVLIAFRTSKQAHSICSIYLKASGAFRADREVIKVALMLDRKTFRSLDQTMQDDPQIFAWDLQYSLKSTYRRGSSFRRHIARLASIISQLTGRQRFDLHGDPHGISPEELLHAPEEWQMKEDSQNDFRNQWAEEGLDAHDQWQIRERRYPSSSVPEEVWRAAEQN